MKKVCFLTNNINQLGGIERVISLLCEGFSRNADINLTIVSLHSNPIDHSFFPISENTFCVHANIPLDQKYDDYLIGYFRKKRFDDLVTFHAGVALVVSRIIDKIKLIQWIVTEHSYPRSYTWKRRLLNQYVYRKADRLVVLTDEIADYYRKRFMPNVTVIPNPVSFISNDLSRYSHNVLAVGRIEEVKRFDLLVEAYGSIANKYPDWKLRIVGGGSQFDKLKQQSEPYNNIELLGSRKDIKELMLDSSFLVISSQFEAFSMVALEAMECGLPIVSTQLPSIYFITKGYNAAIYVDLDNYDDFTDKIEQLMSNPSLIHKMGLEAKECAKQYHLDNILNYWNEIL